MPSHAVGNFGTLVSPPLTHSGRLYYAGANTVGANLEHGASDEKPCAHLRGPRTLTLRLFCHIHGI
jgi:hypothetical protein